MLVEFALLGREQRLISAEHRFLGICTGGMIAETNPLHRRNDRRDQSTGRMCGHRRKRDPTAEALPRRKDWWSWRP